KSTVTRWSRRLTFLDCKVQFAPLPMRAWLPSSCSITARSCDKLCAWPPEPKIQKQRMSPREGTPGAGLENLLNMRWLHRRLQTCDGQSEAVLSPRP
ncbi:MAG: hypothetical protein WAN75_42155, partial [Xanthobacteraceae bacterium]